MLPAPQPEGRPRSAIVDRRGDFDRWYVDGTSLWRVGLLWPVREAFGGRTLAQARGWCLVGMMGWTDEIGVEAFA